MIKFSKSETHLFENDNMMRPSKLCWSHFKKWDPGAVQFG